MRVNIQVLDETLETLESSNSRCHILGYQSAGCVENVNSAHNSNVMYSANSMFKFTMIFHFCHTKFILRYRKCSYELLLIYEVSPKRSWNTSLCTYLGPASRLIRVTPVNLPVERDVIQSHSNRRNYFQR